MKSTYILPILFVLLLFASCSSSGPAGLFRKQSPHEQYASKLNSVGLQHTELGKAWLAAAERCLDVPMEISVPYKESGYFPAENARAVAYRFTAKRGQRLNIQLSKRPVAGFSLYADLWGIKDNGDRKLLASSDTASSGFNYEIEDDGAYLLRLQPELLRSCNFSLSITGGPSLAYPVRGGRTMSFWGADRDQGIRRHEGIDIFAPRRTPALAAASGTVTRVGENNLGGKVVFMRPGGKNYSLYYAHLDEQLKQEGQLVNEGDTLGLIGSTGNAAGGAPHLHFGIYTSAGAIDPLPFVDNNLRLPPAIKADTTMVSQKVLAGRQVFLYSGPGTQYPQLVSLPSASLSEVTGASANWFRLRLPDGREGYASKDLLKRIRRGRSVTLSGPKDVYDSPSPIAAIKTSLNRGSSVEIVGNFDTYHFISSGTVEGWIAK